MYSEPIYVTALSEYTNSFTGSVHDIHFSDVIALSENGVTVWGNVTTRIENLQMVNVEVQIARYEIRYYSCYSHSYL